MARLPARFKVPAEELSHALTFMQWPVTRTVYRRDGDLDWVQTVIARIANTISEFEPVIMLADKAYHQGARRYLSSAVELWDVPTDDLWCRDSGPLFTSDGQGALAVSHIQFNGWGRYDLPNDARVAERVAARLDLPLYDSGLVGEPGGAETNGHGLVIANASSWVNKNRNPGVSRDEIGARLAAAYGAERVIWGEGVKGQDVTDAHIDGSTRFTSATRLVMQDDPDAARTDPFARSDADLRERLRAEGFTVDPLPYAFEGRTKEPGFYANFYVCNGAVIASEYGDREADDAARATLVRHFPDREVIQLETDALLELGGGIHCATQQMPAV